jgi:beta-galactosidase
MNRLHIFFLIALIFSGCGSPEFQKEEMIVTGTSEPVISLNGTWKFSMNPPENFFNDRTSTESWRDIVVPGECAMQGFAIRHNTPVAYKRSAWIPQDWAGRRIKIRFEGVYSYARVWVNGVYIRDHSGGFTPWECDITGVVKPGNSAVMTVEVTDKDNEISYASGYAKHQIGGILRNVSLIALPNNFPESIAINTSFDSRYSDAELKIDIRSDMRERSWISFRLYDSKGVVVTMSDKKFPLVDTLTSISIPVKKPEKWDSEHPVLYTLIASVFDKRIVTASKKMKIGFREVKVNGNELLVNGQKVKLRGACHHDIHPLLGRMSTPEYDELDVQLAKEANMNFIRTSHYPPSESFLKFCDEYGLYVEDETAVCFVDTHRGGIYKSLKQSEPGFIPQVLSQVGEMVTNHINHPSVIIWSLGNESTYNESFKECYEYIRKLDPSRPVMFSYPGSVPDSIRCYDIISLHYPSINGDLEQWGIKVKKFNSDKIPALFDEWAHVPCYDKPELTEDRNVRNFWGRSLDSMWTNVFESHGGLGGAIWGMIDETFMLPDTMSGYNKWWGIQEESHGVRMYEGPTVGYGEWGIIDTWRRKKPEFWNTRKAYSPVKILIDEITNFRPGSPIEIPVFNRFNHTNLREITTKWRYRNKELIALNHNIEPFEKGVIKLTSSDWKEGEYVNIRFYINGTSLVDEYNLRLGKRIVTLPVCEKGNISVVETGDEKARIEGTGFSAVLNKKTGMIEDLVTNNDTLIFSGPWLHFRFPAMSHWSVVPFAEIKNSWKTEKVSYEIKEGCLNIASSGYYEKIKLELNIIISGNGTMIFACNISGIPDNSQIEELGLKFLTGNDFDSLKWDSKSYWNAYPKIHLGMPAGQISLKNANRTTYRMKPPETWEYDNRSFYYDGLADSKNLSFLAGAMKENIYTYSLSTPGKSILSVWSAADKSCRFARKIDGNWLYIDKFWDYISLNWGNYMKNIKLPSQIIDTIYLKVN